MARRKTTKKQEPEAAPEKLDDETGASLEPVDRWIEEIAQAKTRHEKYWDKVKAISRRYKDESADEKADKQRTQHRKYNVLWSVMQTLGPLTYASPPQPYVTRRHNDKDSAARDAAMILQRALTYELEGDELHDAAMDCREDYLLGSRAVMWNKYTPYLKLRESELKTYVEEEEEAPEGSELEKDDDGRLFYHEKFEEKIYEECDVEHVLYSDFLHGAAAKWQHVPWVARRVPMTRKELIKRFGKKVGSLPPLTIQVKDKTKANRHQEDTDDAKGMFAKAEVWEIWDKPSRMVYWLCPQVADTFLDKKEDPLELEDFFPCPRPAFGTKTNESIVPTPDYCMWQDIANELDDVTLRIKLLTEALRVVGIYDKSMGDQMSRLLKQTEENGMVPVDNWAMFAEKGGLKGSIEWLPIEQVMLVLDKLYMARERLLRELYEITGISDIVRGASDPRETAKAQAIKGSFANKRLSERQNVFGRMLRENLEITAQIICRHYSDEMIRLASSAEQVLTDVNGNYEPARFQAALMILRSDPLRRFRIKIDEKKLASADEAEDREQRVQYVQGLSQLIQSAIPLAEQFPAAGPWLKSVIMFVTRGFPIARSEEASMDEALDKLISTPKAQEPQDAQGTGAAAVKGPEELANEREKIRMEAQYKAKQLELEERKLKLEEQKAANEHQFRMAQLQQKDQIAQQDLAIKGAKVTSDAENQQMQLLAQRQDREQDRQMQREAGQREQMAQQNSMRLEERRLGNDERSAAIAAFSGNQPQQRAA